MIGGTPGIIVAAISNEKTSLYGVQFHPEAAKARVERAFDWGHISEEEMASFQREHDGAGILNSFASVIHANTG